MINSLQSCFGGGLLPCQDVLQRLHQSHLFLSSQRRLEKDLWAAQTLRPNKKLVVFGHVEHGLQIKVRSLHQLRRLTAKI